MIALEVHELTKSFGGLTALNHVTIRVEQGSLVGLLGPNGSGKTTLFNCIVGFHKPDSGRVLLRGVDITAKPMERVSEMGLYRTFQLPRAFPELNLLENVLLSQPHRDETWTDIVFRGPSRSHVKRALEVLDFVGLTKLADQSAGTLSGGQQKLLELAAALMKDPEIILLDEPTGGVNPSLINKIKDLILDLHRSGRTFLVIEHNMDVIMDIAQRLYVLDQGELIAEGAPREIRENEQVLEAYFGH